MVFYCVYSKTSGGEVKWYHNAVDFANIFKAFVGTNYLSLSYGFSQAGLVFGIIGLFIVSVMTNHCCKLIVKCKHHLVKEICRKYEATCSNDDVDMTEMAMLKRRLEKNMDYADIGRLVLGKWGAWLVNLFVIITQIGFCIGYAIFVGNMLHGFFKVSRYVPVSIINDTYNRIDSENNLVMKRSVADLLQNTSNNLSDLGGTIQEKYLPEASKLSNGENSSYTETITIPSHFNNYDTPYRNSSNITNVKPGQKTGDNGKNNKINSNETFIHTETTFFNRDISKTEHYTSTEIQVESFTEAALHTIKYTTENLITDMFTSSVTDVMLSNTSLISNATHKHSVDKGPSLTLLTLLSMPVFILLTFFRSVRQLGITSVLANASVLVGFISVLGYIVIDFHISETYLLFIYSTLPVYIAQVVGAYEAIGTIIPIEASMDENRHSFPLSINIVVIVFTCLIGLLASFGYLQFGDETQQIIAQNLPADNPLVILINSTLIFGVVCTYPLQIFPVVEIFEGMLFTEGACCGPPKTYTADDLAESEMKEEDLVKTSLLPSSEPDIGLPIATVVPHTVSTWKRNFFRMVVAMCVCGIAVVLRNVFAYVGALVGAIGSCPLAFILPCLFHAKLMWGKVSTVILVKDIVIMVLGVVFGLIGFVVTLEQIIYRI